MGGVCERTVQNRSTNAKCPLSARGIISIAHLSFAERSDEPLRTPFRNRNYVVYHLMLFAMRIILFRRWRIEEGF